MSRESSRIYLLTHVVSYTHHVVRGWHPCLDIVIIAAISAVTMLPER